MTSTPHTCRRKLANWFALLTIVALLLSGINLPAAQAAPDAPQVTTIIAALSDYGSGDALEQTVATMIAGWSPARVVTAGDNYHYQNCNTYAACVGAYYGSYVTAQTFMPALGNHDYDNPPVGLTTYNNYFTWLPTSPDSQRRWYDFVEGDVHFFILDGNGNQSTQSAWLATTVPQSTSTWNIAVIHQAPYSTGYYGDIAASQLTYGTYGIDFVISGHNHHYERLVKADGGNTVRYFIDGYGGTDAANHSVCNTPPTSAATSEACLADVPGAMKITASNTSITFEYFSSTGALQNAYTQVIGPEITTSVSSLAAFSTPTGTASAPQTYTVAGSNLTADISITAPTGFELSTNGTNYSSGLTLNRSGTSVPTTTIYARLTGVALGTYSGNLAHTSSGATTKNVAVSGAVSTYYTLTVNAGSGGSVTLNPTGGSYASGTVVTLNAVANASYVFYGWSGDLSGSANPTTITMDGNKTVTATFVLGTCTTVNLVASEDTYMSGYNKTYNYGGVDLFKVTSYYTSIPNRGALLKWDVSSIPSAATVSSASLTLYVSTLGAKVYNLYNMRQSWVEGTTTPGAASNASANWNTYNGTSTWGTAGAASTTSDRYDTNLWGADATTFASTGSKTVALDADGVAVVQGWIAGALSNYGVTMQNYATSGANDDLQISSSENTTVANRPKLNVTYCTLTYTPAKPKPPAVTSITQGSGNVVLGWDAVTLDVGDHPTTIDKYLVYGSHDPFFAADVSNLLPQQPAPPWAITFTHVGGSTGTINWYYLVRAHNIAGESVNSVRRTGRFGFTLVPGS